ncbi:hypothetical protein B0A55_07634 [Friedmanniomyces simplex]|uniref:Uncharacterized protein n=1 Tax=Friedmanniomyces simplex TaxID=329884 RepID=A0A4U0WZY2_9PEZI|nr:hypothetical protein B0A55_07634 [Friedmanniomyces simplex]
MATTPRKLAAPVYGNERQPASTSPAPSTHQSDDLLGLEINRHMSSRLADLYAYGYQTQRPQGQHAPPYPSQSFDVAPCSNQYSDPGFMLNPQMGSYRAHRDVTNTGLSYPGVGNETPEEHASRTPHEMGAFGDEPTESPRKKQRLTSPPVARTMPAMTTADDRISATTGHKSSRSASSRSTRSAASQSGELAKTRASGGNTEQSARRHVQEPKKTTKQNKRTGTRAERIVGWNPDFSGDAVPKENVDLPKTIIPVTTYDVSLFTPHPNMSLQTATLASIGRNVVSWPPPEDRSFVTRAVMLALEVDNETWTSADIACIALQQGWVLPADAASAEWDQEGLSRVIAAMKRDGALR